MLTVAQPLSLRPWLHAACCVLLGAVVSQWVTMQWTADCGLVGYGFPFRAMDTSLGSSLQFCQDLAAFAANALCYAVVFAGPAWQLFRRLPDLWLCVVAVVLLSFVLCALPDGGFGDLYPFPHTAAGAKRFFVGLPETGLGNCGD